MLHPFQLSDLIFMNKTYAMKMIMATIMMTARMNMMGTMDLGVKIVTMTMKTTVIKMGMTRMMALKAMRTIEIMT